MARPKSRRPLPDMQSQGHEASHHAPGAASERAWEEPNGIMAQCIAIGDQLVAAAKRTERALRAIGIALTDGEHQFDGPGPEQQADKAEYQRIAEAMFNNLTSDLFPISARHANWHSDHADRLSDQMDPHTEMEMDEHPSYLSDDDQPSDVASASDMPLFADDVDVEPPSAPPSAPPSLPDTEQPTLADEPGLEPEPASVSAQQAAEPEEETLVAPSVPAKKRGKKKKKKAAKAKSAELEQTVDDDGKQAQAAPTDLDLAPPQDDCALSVQTEDEVTQREIYENLGEEIGRIKEEDALRMANLGKSEREALGIIASVHKSIHAPEKLDAETMKLVRQGLIHMFEGGFTGYSVGSGQI
ncbi:hypothetical protein B0T18DRAFT_409509 [Schizothecium vesticola]|uniref:Uncharacterized protein n=1 Tax=Schizothecium vesticola TaxID=314040 RepID=A0AA40K4C7_9PEZI|nr:hypothetical protein B0T18DRAFT_409509 [Schizothecium vesticola]